MPRVSGPPFSQCPIPSVETDCVQLAHGGAGRVAKRLLEELFLQLLSNPPLDERHDSAVIETRGPLAVTTDGFVVRPWRFPGGDIGSLSVHGTVNDLAMAGARPIAMTASFILEEGFPLSSLREIVQSMAGAARSAGISVVAGDTKVVERGRGDGIYIGASGVGEVVAKDPVSPKHVKPGDAILLSGDLGRHGIAVMAARDRLEIGCKLESDAAAVHVPVLALIRSGVPVRCLRDVTRGGLATILNEIAHDSGCGVGITEAEIPVNEDVHAVCEILGLDPLYVACEGRFVAFVPQESAPRALEVLRAHDVSSDARLIGTVGDGPPVVTMVNRLGVPRILDLLSGEQLPRIC